MQRNAFFLAVIPNFGKYTDFRMFDVGNGCVFQKTLSKNLLSNVLPSGLVQHCFLFSVSSDLSGLFFPSANMP